MSAPLTDPPVPPPVPSSVKAEQRKDGRVWVGDGNHYLYVEWKTGLIIGDVRKLGGQEFVAHVRDKKLGRYCSADLGRNAVEADVALEWEAR